MTLESTPRSELIFKGPFNVMSTSIVSLKNTSAQRLAFKLQTTAPKSYQVKPNAGFIAPQAVIQIQIQKQVMKVGENRNDWHKHKFMISWLFVPGDSDKSPDEFLKLATLNKYNIPNIKLQCKFIDEVVTSTEIDRPNGESNAQMDLLHSDLLKTSGDLAELTISVADLFDSVESSARINNEIIQQINEKSGDIDHTTYVVKLENDGRITTTEKIETHSAQELISRWRNTMTLIEVEDIFNDKLDYSCLTYDDLVRLNRDMITVVNKYKRFGDGSFVLQSIRDFRENFLRIHSSLKRLLKSLQLGSPDDLQDLLDRLDNVVNQLKDVRQQYPNLEFA